jgi:uncharacterized protein YxeA
MGETTKKILIMAVAGLAIIVPVGLLVWNNQNLRRENKALRAKLPLTTEEKQAASKISEEGM